MPPGPVRKEHLYLKRPSNYSCGCTSNSSMDELRPDASPHARHQSLQELGEVSREHRVFGKKITIVSLFLSQHMGAVQTAPGTGKREKVKPSGQPCFWELERHRSKARGAPATCAQHSAALSIRKLCFAQLLAKCFCRSFSFLFGFSQYFCFSKINTLLLLFYPAGS